VLSLAAAAPAIVIAVTRPDAGLLLTDPTTTAVELVVFGTVGAILIHRRPDLPFGWVLGLAACADIVLVGIGVPSLALAYDGRGGQLALWGVSLGVLQWAPTALAGIINLRFPAGRPASRLGSWLDRALCIGIPVGLVGTYLGDTVTANLDRPVPGRRFIDGTWVTDIGNASVILVPVLILLGILAGIGVIVRFFRATGIERAQLQWRACGAAVSLLLFPLALVDALAAIYTVSAPVIFVATLAIPVLRFQLWAGDPVPRRRRVGLLVSRRTLIEAQEEERRRLRRDLHDGLGPLLTGLRLNLDAAEAQFSHDPDKARQHLATARAASTEVISDLRGLVYGLRPPALDELGLTGSLRLHVAALVKDSPLEVILDADDELTALAASEVAVYRTVVEAVTNVIRHSDATRCVVTLTTHGNRLALTVADNGRVHGTWRPGVGLTAMRERAVELGGTFVASSGPTGFDIAATYPRR